MRSSAAALLLMASLGGMGKLIAEDEAMRRRAHRYDDPIRQHGRRKPRKTKGERLNSRPFPTSARKAPYMPAPPKGFIYARDEGKSGTVPRLVRRRPSGIDYGPCA